MLSGWKAWAEDREELDRLRNKPSLAEEPIGYLFQHEETGLTQVVEVQQVEWGYEKNNPRWQKISPVYAAPVSEPSPRAQALEEAAKIAFDVSENGHYYGEASVDSTSSIYQQGAFEVYEALRALSSQPIADHIADAGKMVADGCKAYVGEMKTSSGTDYFVMIKSGGRELSIRKHQWKHHADYEAAEYNWLFNGGEKPDILEYREAPGASK